MCRSDCLQRVEELRHQARLAEHAGFHGVMLSEHHGGFPGYWPIPLQVAGWALDATRTIWAAPCPLLLPLRAWTQVAEEIAWLSTRHPGRVGAGFGSGGLAFDFELAELAFELRERADCDSLNVRIHARGLAPEVIRAQIERLGPALRAAR